MRASPATVPTQRRYRVTSDLMCREEWYVNAVSEAHARALVAQGKGDFRVVDRLKDPAEDTLTCEEAPLPPRVFEGDGPLPLRLGVLTALWKRPTIAAKVLEHFAKMDITSDLILLAVGSEGEKSESLSTKYGWNYVEAPNVPLGNKWNVGMEAIGKLGVEAVLIVGSDDLIEYQLVRLLADKTFGGEGYVGLQDIYFTDSVSGQTGYFPGHGERRGYDPIGAGRIFSQRALEQCKWRPWPDRLMNGLDSGCHKRMTALGITPSTLSCKETGLIAVDIKSSQNIWSFTNLKTGGKMKRCRLDAEGLKERFEVLR